MLIYTGGGGGGKCQYPYVGLNSSVTECPIEIILSGMTYDHHWFKEFVKSKHIGVLCFQMKVHFRIYLIFWIIGSSQNLLNCVWPVKLPLPCIKNSYFILVLQFTLPRILTDVGAS